MAVCLHFLIPIQNQPSILYQTIIDREGEAAIEEAANPTELQAVTSHGPGCDVKGCDVGVNLL